MNVSPVGSLRERVFQLFGEELLEDLVELSPRREQVFASSPEPGEQDAAAPPGGPGGPSGMEPQFVTLSGFLSRPQVQKLNRNSIYIFVNRRLIRDRILLHAIHEAYRNILPSQCFPVALLFLEMPYGEVDVNVHPAKVEVRFRHQSFVHDLVRDTLRECLTATKPISTFPAGATWAPELPHPPSGTGETAPADRSAIAPSPARLSDGFTLTEPPPPAPSPPQDQPLPFGLPSEFSRGAAAATAASAPAPATSGSELAELRPLGQINDSFIVASTSSGLWLIDQHVAHERVLFEKFLSQRDKGAIESQRLLMPYVLRLTVAQQALWAQISGELEAAGFDVEPFGQNTVAVKAAPAGVRADDIEKLLFELIESLESESRSFSAETVRHKIAASVACHAAIKINTPLELRKMEWLLSELAATRFPMSCPHGRPVVLKYEMREILKAFHRI